jgi:hypothetical protein
MRRFNSGPRLQVFDKIGIVVRQRSNCCTLPKIRETIAVPNQRLKSKSRQSIARCEAVRTALAKIVCGKETTATASLQQAARTLQRNSVLAPRQSIRLMNFELTYVPAVL